jgi:hypothetical protein
MQDELHIAEHDLSSIHHEFCSCGGRGPDHPEACNACQMYHEIMKCATRDED